MISVDVAIHRVRRDITLGVLLKGVFIAAIMACFIFAPAQARFAALAGVVAAWIALSVTSARSSRIASDSPTLIATGQFDEAERQIDQAVRAFSLFSPAKLRALHQLATLRHAQRRWQEAAALCKAVVAQRIGAAAELSKPSRLILAESLLQLNDMTGSYEALLALYHQKLSLQEVLNLLSLQLAYETKIGAWQKMFTGVVSKTQLAELMPAAHAARAQAVLALSAMKVGRLDWSDWLRRRSELLADATVLAAEEPRLRELWKTPEQPLSTGSPLP